MALKCRCICGCKLLVSSDSAGKRIKCPKCERKLRVPLDVVEKRQTQLESRTTDATVPAPRSGIVKPLSSYVELPEPEPPPIQAKGERAAEEARETSKSTRPAAPRTPAAPDVVPSKFSSSEPASPERSVATEAAARSSSDEDELRRRPPPLPKRSPSRVANPSDAIESDAIESDAIESDAIEPDAIEPDAIDAGAIKSDEPRGPGDEHVSPAALKTSPDAAPESASDAAFDNVTEVPDLELEGAAVAVQGYRANRDQIATVRWLAAAVLLAGLIGTVPAVIDVVEHLLSESSGGLSRWACGLFLVSLLQCAFAVYLVQLPDWSSVWVVTVFTLAVAAGYAAMLGLTLLSSDDSHFVQVLDLADRLRGGKAAAWCLIMLSLMSLTSYFSGRVGTRWRRAFFA